MEIARAYDEQGADELVFLDITASHEGRDIMLDMVRRVAEQVFHAVRGRRGDPDDRRCDEADPGRRGEGEYQYGRGDEPGYRGADGDTIRALRDVVNIDPKRVTAADFIKHFQESGREEPADGGWRMADGGWLSAEALSDPSAIPHRPSAMVFEVHTHGGRKPTGLEALAYARYVVELGAGEIILTSMDADGTKDGYDIEITKAIADAVDVPVVASGGCGNPEHMKQVFEQTRADAALAASIFHYG